MTIETPGYDHAGLGRLSSRLVDVDRLEWRPTKFAGIDLKILLEDKETGLSTCLFRWAAGSELPLHEHAELEQTFVLQGRLIDEDGEAAAGNFVWRPAGSRHVARAPQGALVLCFFLKPNRFF